MRLPSQRWRLWLLATPPLVGAVALGYALALACSRGVTEANCWKLQEGMTCEQVEDILGAENRWDHGPGPPGSRWIRYYDQDACVEITVVFDRYRLTDKSYRHLVVPGRSPRSPQTLGGLLLSRLAKVRRRLGL